MIYVTFKKKSHIKLEENAIKQMQAFTYLGSLIAQNGMIYLELKERLGSIDRLI